MKAITIIVLSAGIFATGCVHGGRLESGEAARAKAVQDEADLAAALAGRTAGPPQDCVSQRDLEGGRSYGRGVILFGRGTDEVAYVNRPAGGCPEITTGRALKSRTPTTRLCRGDIVVVFDPVSGMEYGSCSLGEFTPYRRGR